MYRLLYGTLAAASILTAGVISASAATCFDPPSTCTAGTEVKVFLEQENTGSTLVKGNVGSQSGTPVVDFTSTSLLNAGNGFANITPHTGSSFSTLDITGPGFTFTDLAYDVQMLKTGTGSSKVETFTIEALNGNTVVGTHTYTGLNHDADLSFLVVAGAGQKFTEIELSSTTGFKEVKHFQLSGLDPVPVPAALPLFAGGLGVLGVFGWRKRKSKNVAIAA
jgi:hypothetical protein